MLKTLLHNVSTTRSLKSNHQFTHNFLKLRHYSTTYSSRKSPYSSIPYFPYGKANFEDIRRNKQFYVDKTRFIPLLERTGEQLFLVRPPRWGKTLLLSMLASYYDIKKKESFRELFGGLWIGKRENFTPLKHQYHVLHFDLSINIAGSFEDIEKALFNKINRKIEDFVMRYQVEDVRIERDALSSLDSFFHSYKRTGLKLMILVDEYDRFSNKLMFENPRMMEESGEKIYSLIHSFFERLKEASSFLSGFRTLLVGITPVSIGFVDLGIDNISHYEVFNHLVGFSENDLRKDLNDTGILDKGQDSVISTLNKFFNSGTTQTLFNPVQSMYFLKKASGLGHETNFRSRVLEGTYISISELTDNNTKISDSVFATLSKTPVSTRIIYQLLATNSVVFFSSIVSYLNLFKILNPTSDMGVEEVWDNTLSFMYYHGMLTFQDSKTLVIPNKLVEQQYFSELERQVSLEKEIRSLYNNPSEDNLKNILESIIGERFIDYDNNFSERELQHAIYCVFQAYYNFGKSLFQITSKHGNSEDFNETLDEDFIKLESDKDVILIDVKRIRLDGLKWYRNQLDYILQCRDELQPKLLKEQHNRIVSDVLRGKWGNPKTIEIINESLFHLFETELIDFPLGEKYPFRNNKELKSVGDVVQESKAILVDHVNSLKESKPIHAFIVIQVGAPIIVKKIEI